jgi:alkylation response protein AidB-like acyl-CoA dehydrogenase
MSEPSPAFHLTPAQEALRERARRAAEDRLAAIVESGPPGRVNRSLMAALAEEGLLPVLFPSRLGGAQEGEISAADLCLLREGLALACPEAETALALQGLGGYPILQSGTTEVAARWVPRLARGEAVAAFALSEPEAGSDPASLRLEARRDGDGWRLTGEKVWISNAPDADVYTLFARTDPEAGARGVTAFCVPGDSDGLDGEPLELIAPHPIGRLRLDAVRVPDSAVLGEVDRGFRVAMRTLDLFRPSVGAFAVGMAQCALDLAMRHACGRVQFGSPIVDFQAVAHPLAEMATRVQAARLLVHAAAAAYDAAGRADTKASAMAKLFATETAQRAVDVAVQVVGARALEKGHPLEHLYREVRAPRIYEGTSEIQRTIIARELRRAVEAERRP